MAKASRTSAVKVQDFGVAEDRSSDLGGYTVNFVTVRQAHDLAPMLASLPTGHCECPHWGYVLHGRMIVRYETGETETYNAGDAFYMRSGHAPAADAETQFVQFSPTDQLAASEKAVTVAMAAMAAR